MKKILFFPLCLFFIGAFGQGERYLSRTFDHISITQGIAYSYGNSIGDSAFKTLCFDLYEPAFDTMQLRPLVIPVFGGSFIAGNRTWPDMEAYADSLAHYGYVVAPIDYRLLPIKYLSQTNIIRAGYVAAQDINSAIRYFKANSETYRIDTNRIFLLGNSAGSIAALYAVFMDAAERPIETFQAPDLGDINIAGPPEIRNISDRVTGIISQWGGVADLRIIDSCEAVPICLIHGTGDKTVPYEEGKSPKLGIFAPYMYGSAPIAQRLKSFGCLCELHPFKGEPHAFYFMPDQYHLIYNKFNTCLHLTIEFLYNNIMENSAVR